MGKKKKNKTIYNEQRQKNSDQRDKENTDDELHNRCIDVNNHAPDVYTIWLLNLPALHLEFLLNT
jgi:hypothetical protein